MLRHPLEPTVATRRIANVRWGGADLAALLDEIGIDARARYLWSYGLDGGEFAGTSCDLFVKDLPLRRLAAGDVLLAYELKACRCRRSTASQTASPHPAITDEQRQMAMSAGARRASRRWAVYDHILQRPRRGGGHRGRSRGAASGLGDRTRGGHRGTGTRYGDPGG